MGHGLDCIHRNPSRLASLQYRTYALFMYAHRYIIVISKFTVAMVIFYYILTYLGLILFFINALKGECDVAALHDNIA